MDVTLYMTVADAAVELGISRPRVWQIIKAGKLVIKHRMGRIPLVLRKDVEAIRPQVTGKAGRPKSAPPARKPRGKGERT